MKPVAVLSNNDGCIVSRSNEVKALGIPMGGPAFKYADILKEHKVTVFSSNFSLYADISHRVMSVISRYAPEMEMYSIDEAFIQIDNLNDQYLLEYGENIKAVILREVGIPVSIGVSSTKTRAKLANELAKTSDLGVAVIPQNSVITHAEKISVSDVWGIGRALTQILSEHGIVTVNQLIACDEVWVRKNLTLSGLKVVQELKGISCIPFEEFRTAKQSIISSKSFGIPVTTITQIKEAVASYTTRAAEKLRAEHECASHIGVSLTTNIHSKNTRQYYNSSTHRLLEPTNYTPELISEALKIVDKLFRTGYLYKKAVVSLVGLDSEKAVQQGLFRSNGLSRNSSTHTKQRSLMNVIDHVNCEYGSGTVAYLAEGISKQWKGRRERSSPRYTTRWEELAVATASR